MSPWAIGAAEIDALLSQGHLQRVRGGEANGRQLLERASRTLHTATAIAQDDPDSAFVLAYDAARYGGTALLAQQGLRPTTTGGHYVVEVALRTQFGSGFRPFGALRRRRNELEYPHGYGDTTTTEEALAAIDTARDLVDASSRLLPTLGFF